MSHVVDLEAQQQVAQVTVAPHATGAFFPPLLSSPSKRVVMGCDREEDVGGAETRHEMNILGPHMSNAASSLRSEAQSVISQAEGVASIWP